MERCSTYWSQGKANQTPVRYHINTLNVYYLQENGVLMSVWREGHVCALLAAIQWKTLWRFLKKLNLEYKCISKMAWSSQGNSNLNILQHSFLYFWEGWKFVQYLICVKYTPINQNGIFTASHQRQLWLNFFISFSKDLIDILRTVFLLHRFSFQVGNGEPLKILELGRTRAMISDLILAAVSMTK